MNALIIDEAAHQVLAALNAAGDPHHQLHPIQIADGTHVLNADLLNDTGPEGTWLPYAAFLSSLPARVIDTGEFITASV